MECLKRKSSGVSARSPCAPEVIPCVANSRTFGEAPNISILFTRPLFHGTCFKHNKISSTTTRDVLHCWKGRLTTRLLQRGFVRDEMEKEINVFIREVRRFVRGDLRLVRDVGASLGSPRSTPSWRRRSQFPYDKHEFMAPTDFWPVQVPRPEHDTRSPCAMLQRIISRAIAVNTC